MSDAPPGRRAPGVRRRILLMAATATFLLAASAVSDVPIQRCGMPSDLREVVDFEAGVAREACYGSRSGYLTRLGRLLADRARESRAAATEGEPEAEGSRDALRVWRSDRLVQMAGEAPWVVPRDPTWKENPYRNLTWQSRYHSLEWLAPAAQAYREGDSARGDDVRRYVLDWIASNPREAPAARRAWYDGAVWRRTNAIVRYWDVLADVMSPGELRTVLLALHEHGVQLNDYLSDARFTGHNHNLFHALALHNLAVAIPELTHAGEWRGAAYERIETLAAEMLNPVDGVSTEQAASYHALALNVYARAAEYLARHGTPLPAPTLELLARATRFGALVPAPGGYLPAIGDTMYGASDGPMLDSLRRLAALGVGSDVSEYVLSRGRQGQRPPDATFFRGEGYAIFRPSFGDDGDWEDDLHVFVDMGPTRRFHGHHDAQNVLISVGGQPILVDSGGPFKYGSPGREAIVRPAAHNTIIVDGVDEPRNGADISWTADTRRYLGVTGTLNHSLGLHRRTVLLLKPSTVVVLDHVVASGTRRHRYAVRYHLDPDAAVTAAGRTASIQVGGVAVDLRVADAVVGSTTPSGELTIAEGWVTPRMNQRRRASVVEYTVRAADACIATAIETSGEPDRAPPGLQLAAEEDGCTLIVRARGRAWEISLGGDSVSVVRR